MWILSNYVIWDNQIQMRSIRNGDGGGGVARIAHETVQHPIMKSQIIPFNIRAS